MTRSVEDRGIGGESPGEYRNCLHFNEVGGRISSKPYRYPFEDGNERHMTQVHAAIACLTCDISSIETALQLLKVTLIWSSQVGKSGREKGGKAVGSCRKTLKNLRYLHSISLYW